MNNIYGALGITILLLLIVASTILFKGRAVCEPIMTQSMLHHERSRKRKYVEKINKKSQSKIRQEKENVRVIIVENEAYWVKDNAFYTAPLVNDLIHKDYAVQLTQPIWIRYN